MQVYKYIYINLLYIGILVFAEFIGIFHWSCSETWLYFGIYVRIVLVCDTFPFEVFIHSFLHISVYFFCWFCLFNFRFVFLGYVVRFIYWILGCLFFNEECFAAVVI